MTDLNLAFGFSLKDLYTNSGIKRLHENFLVWLRNNNNDLWEEYKNIVETEKYKELSSPNKSILMMKLAKEQECYIGELFNIKDSLLDYQNIVAEASIFNFVQRRFIARRLREITSDEAVQIDGLQILSGLELIWGKAYEPKIYAEFIKSNFEIIENKQEDKIEQAMENLKKAFLFAAWVIFNEDGRRSFGHHPMFWRPEKVDFDNLTKASLANNVAGMKEYSQLDKNDFHIRTDFSLTDCGGDWASSQYESLYCSICHEREKDLCRKGHRLSKEIEYKDEYDKNPLGVELTGCPLGVNISEMHAFNKQGRMIAGLLMVAINNAMCAGTGHRICNECIKACIYQKQTPVNTPLVESYILRKVLELPYGFEVYQLITRWNVANFDRPYPKDNSGYSVLVVGMGPAGYTLAHNLTNYGHNVVGIDGLKIEPLSKEINGIDENGTRVEFKPIKDAKILWTDLDEKSPQGFGGVSEYGITVRWDKNFLTILRVILERRDNFRMFGGIRFGGTITAKTAYEMGFDHISLCLGAGRPTTLDIEGGVAKGVKQASDFLMALQSTGAGLKDSITNLQLRLPILVIGGGLTAMDAATESIAYYFRQIEKFYLRYTELVRVFGEKAIRGNWTEAELEIVDEYLNHYEEWNNEVKLAQIENRKPELEKMLESWGGVSIAYRRRLQDSPSYQLNDMEIAHALQQGVKIIENATPDKIICDESGAVQALRLINTISKDALVLPAHTVIVAAGTQPNTVLEREFAGVYKLDGKYFEAIDENGELVKPSKDVKNEDAKVLMYCKDTSGDKFMSFLGDLHPTYAGNVVKAMSSALRAVGVIDKILFKTEPALTDKNSLMDDLNNKLLQKVVSIKKLNANALEIVIKAPLVADQFQAGQFFRLQNFTASSNTVSINGIDTLLSQEPIALTGAKVDKEKGEVTLVALNMGGSTSIISLLQVGEHVLLMGPTGTPTHIPNNQVVVTAGGGLGNAVLISVNKALKDAGNYVIYFAAYKKSSDIFYMEQISQSADMVIWCCDEIDENLKVMRVKDKIFFGNIVDAMYAYATGKLGEVEKTMKEVGTLITVGSDRMMNAVKVARQGILLPYIGEHVAIASIPSLMQCMLKEICASCIQLHVDNEGKKKIVYSCFDQDQNMDEVDFDNLQQRLGQNSVQEKLVKQWLSYLRNKTTIT